MPPTPVVSIGLPVFNGEHSIATAVESLLKQTEGRFELIISDNASTDGTERMCRELANSDTRIRYVRQPINRGAWWNFHFVLEQAQGEYFMWAAHDDVWETNWIASLLADFGPGVATVCGTIVGVNGEGEELGRIGDFGLAGSRVRRMLHYFLIEESAGKANLIYGLHRTEYAKKCVFETNRSGVEGEDMHFVFQILGYGMLKHSSQTSMYKDVRPARRVHTLGSMLSSIMLFNRFQCYLGYLRICPGAGVCAAIFVLLPFKYIKGIVFSLCARAKRLRHPLL